MRRLIVLLAASTLLLAGCGLKGPLYLPAQKPQQKKTQVPPTPPSATGSSSGPTPR